MKNKLSAANLALGLFLGASTLLTQTGCLLAAAAGAGAGGVGYVKGDMETYTNANLAGTVAACDKAMQRLGYTKIKEEGDAAKKTITGRTSQDTKITLVITQVGTATSKLSIRFGVFGDEALSQSLYNEIKKAL